MFIISKNAIRGLALAAAATLPSLAMSSSASAQQPLGFVGDALALPGQIIAAPFEAFSPSAPAPATARQPLGIVVNALALPGRVIAAPFGAFAPPAPNAYDPAPARADAVAYTDDLLAVIPAPVLKATGPRYDNPVGADYRRPYVIRQGGVVPGFIDTAVLENVSVAGLAPGGRYDYFVSPEQRTVILDRSTRQVVRILR